MTAKLLRLIALISSNSGIKRSRSTTNVCTNLNALVVHFPPHTWHCLWPATPATRNDGGCEIVPRLPRKTKVDVRLCHTCHAMCRERWCVTRSTPATRNDGGCEIVPRLPRKTKVDVRLCHACHAKCRGVTGGCAAPATSM